VVYTGKILFDCNNSLLFVKQFGLSSEEWLFSKSLFKSCNESGTIYWSQLRKRDVPEDLLVETFGNNFFVRSCVLLQILRLNCLADISFSGLLILCKKLYLCYLECN